jgi:hypothetical protein
VILANNVLFLFMFYFVYLFFVVNTNLCFFLLMTVAYIIYCFSIYFTVILFELILVLRSLSSIFFNFSLFLDSDVSWQDKYIN